MEEALAILRVRVKAHGLVQVAHILGHNNTQTLSRWLKINRIPGGKVKGIIAIFEEERAKMIKGKR